MIRRSRWRRSRPVNCRELGKVLQSYLDDDVEPEFADRIAEHLEACRDCGLEAETYRSIKAALADRRSPVDSATIDRLRAFGDQLTTGEG